MENCIKILTILGKVGVATSSIIGLVAMLGVAMFAAAYGKKGIKDALNFSVFYVKHNGCE